MSKNKNIYLSVFAISALVIFQLSCFTGFHERRIKNFKHEIESKFSYGKTTLKENYQKDCETEEKNNIVFPFDYTEKAILHNMKSLSSKIKLSKNQIQGILKIINDTSSYEWGEIGTPTFTHYITFYNIKKECIGILEIDPSGQTYSSPSLAKMKWGFLKEGSVRKFKEIIGMK